MLSGCFEDVPKLYEYLGLTVSFYSDEHLPVHVHGRFERREHRAELVIKDGLVVAVNLGDVPGRAPLRPNELKNFEHLLMARADEMLQKWVAFLSRRRLPQKLSVGESNDRSRYTALESGVSCP